MTFHFAADLPEMGIGVVSDSAVSFRRGDGSWERLDTQPKTFIVSSNAAISCAGDAETCLKVVDAITTGLAPDATFTEVAPRLQQTYRSVATHDPERLSEFLLFARTDRRKPKLKLIRLEPKQIKLGLVRLERDGQHHYTAGLQLPALVSRICETIAYNYPIAGRLSDQIGAQICAASGAIASPRSLALGICFGPLMAVAREFVGHNGLSDVIGGPWTILLMPVDGPIHFQSGEMYDGSRSVQPFDMGE